MSIEKFRALNQSNRNFYKIIKLKSGENQISIRNIHSETHSIKIN